MALLVVNLHPTRRELRQFGVIALVAFGLLGGWILWRGTLFGIDLGTAGPIIAYVLWGVGLVSGVLSAVAPAANRLLYVAMIVLTYPIGFVVSHVILAFVFYGIITPIGLVFRLTGRDALRRKFEPDAASYWIAHREPGSVERYFRQF